MFVHRQCVAGPMGHYASLFPPRTNREPNLFSLYKKSFFLPLHIFWDSHLYIFMINDNNNDDDDDDDGVNGDDNNDDDEDD